MPMPTSPAKLGTAVVEQVLAAERGARRKLRGLQPGAQAVAAHAIPAAAADDHEGPFGALQHPLQLAQVGARGRRAHRLVMRHVGHRGFREQHVLGEREHHRPGPAGHRRVESVAHVLGNALGAVDLRHPLGHRPVHAPVVDLLESLALDEFVADLADEHHHGRGILESRMHADRAVGGARTTRDEEHARLAGELAVGLRHVGGAALLPADDEPELLAHVVEAVEHRQVALARHAEGELRTVADERVGEDAAAVAHFQIVSHAVSPRTAMPVLRRARTAAWRRRPPPPAQCT